MLEAISELVAGYQYLALFGILFISAMGVPIPEEPVLLAGGLAVGWNHATFPATLIACLLGVLGGDLYIYWLGRLFGDRFLRTRLGRFVFPAKRRARIHKLYERHGNKTVFFGRFIPAVRFGVFFFAGQLRLPVPRFVALNLAGAILNLPISIGIGWFAAARFIDPVRARAFAERLLHEYQFWFFLGIGLIIAGIVIRACWPTRQETETTPPGEGAKAEG